MSTAQLIAHIEQRLGPDKEFFEPLDLVRAGVFRSPTAAYAALRSGLVSHIRVSRNRTLISRQSVLDLLRAGAVESKNAPEIKSGGV